MPTPPVPPRPVDSYNNNDWHRPPREPSLPPPIPPLPSDFHSEPEPLTPHLTEPLVAPRPQKLMNDVPSDMARRLDDQLTFTPPPQQHQTPYPYQQPQMNYGPQQPQYYPPPQSFPNGPGGFRQLPPPQQDPYRGFSPYPPQVGFASPPPLRMAPSPQPGWASPRPLPQQFQSPPPIHQTSPQPQAGFPNPNPNPNTAAITQSMHNLTFSPPPQPQPQPLPQQPYNPNPPPPQRAHAHSHSATLPPSTIPAANPLPTPSSYDRRQAQSTSPPRKHGVQGGSSSASLTGTFPTVQSLSESRIQVSSDTALLVQWSKDVLWLVDRAQPSGNATNPPQGPARLTDPQLQSLAEHAVNSIIHVAPPLPLQSPTPQYLAEAVYLRAKLTSSGAFPELVQQNQRESFRLFEACARAGYAPGWFQLGRDYEGVNDFTRAKDCFERGVKAGVESCCYRMGMANLLGQLNLPVDLPKAITLLQQAANHASIDVPQPTYVYGLLLLGEFPSATIPPPIFAPFIPPGSTPHLEARRYIERAAYLGFSPAQYKMGHAYEYAVAPFPFDPLLSVQYYSLASQQGEEEADMALSKWFLCGSEGNFDKDEGLAFTFAEKAARKGLVAAMFAMGYYAEVGVGRPKDMTDAIKWYSRAAEQGNTDAQDRLAALRQPSPKMLSRAEHEDLTDTTLVRRRTQAKNDAIKGGRVLPDPNGPRRVQAEEVVGNIRKNSLLHKPPPRESSMGSGVGRWNNATPPTGRGAGIAAGRPQPQVNVGAGRGSVPGSLTNSPTEGRRPTLGGVGGAAPTDGRRPSLPGGPGGVVPTDSRRPSLPGGPGGRPPQQPMTPPQQFGPLKDDGPQPRPTTKPSGPATFAEMGYQSQKLEDKECIIM